MEAQTIDQATVAYIGGSSSNEIWGMSGRERAVRLVQRLGLVLREELETTAIGPAHVLMIRADAILEERVARALMRKSGVLLVTPTASGLDPLAACVASEHAVAAASLLRERGLADSRVREAGLNPLEASEVVGFYNRSLRKRAQPFALQLTAANAAKLESITFDAACKGVTDFVTKFIWPRPAFHITRFLSHTGVTPNMVTAVSLTLTLLFFPLVLSGYFRAAVVCAWTMTLLDTVDGKLARVTLRSSKWGNVFDHGIDRIAPPLWWLAWWFGLPEHGDGLIYWSVWAVVGGHIAGKLVEQAFISTFGIKTHIWRKSDSAFRLITARRNPNLVILTLFTILGLPDVGYLTLAMWVLLCLVVHSGRYLWALIARLNGEAITSWLEA